MDILTATAISVGILSGVWAWLGDALGLITWVGFIGCTSYFASGGKGVGFKKSIIANFTGVLWAMCIIVGSSFFTGNYWSYILTGIFSGVMCIQAKAKILSFIPGAFCGACCTFGTGGDWKAVIIALICGAILGYTSDLGGVWLHKLVNKNSETE